MSFILVGTSYKYAALGIREKLFFSKKDILVALRRLIENGIVKGAVILSTCLRTEIYAEAEETAFLKDFLARFKGESSDCFEGCFYTRVNEEAITHLFTVAAGLDSQLIGENEIFHQVKEAFFLAKRFEATTSLLNRIFERAFFMGKVVRQESLIYKTDPSLAKAAVTRAEQLTGDLVSSNIFIVGAGILAEAIAHSCAEKGARCIMVANRTFIKAERLAKRINGEAIRFEEFYEHLDDIDILFSATASPHLVLKKDLFEQRKRLDKRMIIFDLALPRDVDPAIGTSKNVRLFNLDDMGRKFPQSLNIEYAEQLIREKSERFSWKLGLASDPALLR